MMNVLPIALPSLMVLVGILLNQNGLTRLDSRITTLEGSLRGEINRLRGEIKAVEVSLRAEMATLRAEIVSLRAAFHSDVLMLVERDTRLESRVAQLERAS